MSILFGAGQNRQDKGVLSAFSFDRHFDIVDMVDFDDIKDCIIQTTRNDDIILVGGGIYLRLYYFRNNGFRVLRRF